MAVGGSHHCRCSSVKRYVVDRGCCMDRLCICGKETTKCGSKIARTVGENEGERREGGTIRYTDKCPFSSTNSTQRRTT